MNPSSTYTAYCKGCRLVPSYIHTFGAHILPVGLLPAASSIMTIDRRQPWVTTPLIESGPLSKAAGWYVLTTQGLTNVPRHALFLQVRISKS